MVGHACPGSLARRDGAPVERLRAIGGFLVCGASFAARSLRCAALARLSERSVSVLCDNDVLKHVDAEQSAPLL